MKQMFGVDRTSQRWRVYAGDAVNDLPTNVNEMLKFGASAGQVVPLVCEKLFDPFYRYPGYPLYRGYHLHPDLLGAPRVRSEGR